MNPFHRQSLALVAATGGRRGPEPAALIRAASDGGPDFADYVLRNMIGSLWLHRLRGCQAHGSVTPGFLERLQRHRLGEAALYAGQIACLRDIDARFTTEGIRYAVIKGAHVRELVYPEPDARAANDIDVLVHPRQKEAAARILLRCGFAYCAAPENISHEATFACGPIAIDLHWDILRPGRTRYPMAETMLARRVRVGQFYGVQDTDALLLMLTHAAFSRYVCSPTAAVAPVADLLLWLRERPVDWDALALRLEKAGVKSAAWAQLLWLSMLVDPADLPIPDRFLDSIRPGALRRGYLARWLRHDLPTRLFDHPALVQAGFTLLFHDLPSDALRAVVGWRKSRRARLEDPFLAMAEAMREDRR